MTTKQVRSKKKIKSRCNQWVPVGDGLPTDSEPVLIAWGGIWVGIGWCTKKGNWRDIEGKFPHEVTHWMPMPDHPNW